jgi:CO/xanthine dehydrogenase FAD-binding subunit
MILDESGICGAASVVLTAVASAPVYVQSASTLQGRQLTRDAIEAVAEAAAGVSHPVDNTDLDYWYRKRMTKVYVKRALAELAGFKTEVHPEPGPTQVP